MTADTSESGLYASFEGYRSVTDEEKIEAVKNSIVVLDTNVLLSLYNFQGTMLEDFTKVFAAIGARLFVPHQVMDEFWRNRRIVLSENQGRHREQATIEKAFQDIESAFRKWHQRVVDNNPPPAAAMRELSEAREAVLDFMEDKNTEAAATRPDTPTHDDRVLQKLEPILVGKVGPAPGTRELELLRAEGRARLQSKTPPGYMDSEKNPDRAIGDFLVWRQAIDASRERGLPILIVTQDMKEDWWADRGTESRRARPELVAELLAETGKRLIMIRATDLVALGPHLGVLVSDVTLDQAEQTAEQAESDDEEEEGWNKDLVLMYLEWLEGWPRHASILREAVENGGEITRARMADILEREPDAGMTGVGKPFVTVLRKMEMEEYLNNPFFAYYQDGGWMSHFVMPERLVPLFTAALREHENRVS